MGKAVGVEFAVCECVNDDSRIHCDFDVTAAHVLSDTKALVLFVVIAMIVFKQLAAFQELAMDLLLLGVKLKRECL